MLGFRPLVKAFVSKFAEHLDVFDKNYYDKFLKELNDKITCLPEWLAATWFSDSFIFYTFDASYEAFVHLNMTARQFFVQASSVDMPLRGALSLGHFYADKTRGTYIGDALIEAYEYAEKQDWVGFVLTPRTIERVLKHVRLSRFLAHESEYRRYQVPVKLIKDTKVELNQEELYAFKFYKDSSMIRKVEIMYQAAKNNVAVPPGVLRKYDNTMKFIKEKT